MLVEITAMLVLITALLPLLLAAMSLGRGLRHCMAHRSGLQRRAFSSTSRWEFLSRLFLRYWGWD